MQYRIATCADAPLLARLNQQLVIDEKHRYATKPLEFFHRRMLQWLGGEYRAIIFELEGEVVAYAIDRDEGEDGIYLRQLFVVRHRRRQGIGRRVMQTLMAEFWPNGRRLFLDVLAWNCEAIKLYEQMGYRVSSQRMHIMPEPVTSS